MFTLWKECLPPSVIEHAVSAHIATNHDTLPNLIVARDSLLQIYRVIEEEVLDVVENQGEDPDEQAAADINEESGGAFIKLTAKNIRKNARLELVFESRLHGNIASMAVIRTTSSSKYGRDALLLGFKDAKMSLLEWCTVTNTLITVSIHHYEDDNYRREFLNNPNELEICVEPSFRCAILPIYNTHLAILPFRQENQLLDTSEGSNKWPYVPSMVIPFHEISSEIKNVLSVRFLNNFYEPTIAILYEPIETWTG
jgi:cleavage and polyadenylation specificity factor subunit 1